MDAANGPARPSLKSLLVLGFDPRQKGEQLALSSNVGRLVRPEPGIAIDKELVAASGISVIQSNGSSTVSLGSLLESASVPKVNPNGEALLQAVNEMAGENVGILAIMGQYTSPPKGSATDYFVLGRKEKRYVGLVLRNASSLQLVRGDDDGDAPDEKVLDVTQLSRSLAKCKLIMLYGAFGIPSAGLPGTGPQWATWLKGAANTPIVLGWFGSVRMPQDGYNEFVGGEFLKAVQKLLPGQDIETICLAQEENVIQAWGKACFKTFASEKKTAKGDAVRRMQKYLWYDKPLAFTDFFTTGAGAIGTDGRVWHADPDYDPTVQNAKAMKVVQP